MGLVWTGFGRCSSQNIRGVFWPNLEGAFEVVLAGRLGNQSSLISEGHESCPKWRRLGRSANLSDVRIVAVAQQKTGTKLELW